MRKGAGLGLALGLAVYASAATAAFLAVTIVPEPTDPADATYQLGYVRGSAAGPQPENGVADCELRGNEAAWASGPDAYAAPGEVVVQECRVRSLSDEPWPGVGRKETPPAAPVVKTGKGPSA